MTKKKKFAFDKINFILTIVGILIIISGFLLMTGPSSTETHFEPDIFSARRTQLAPVVSFIGFLFLIIAILKKPNTKK